MTAEEWRPVVSSPGYTVSSHGRVRSTRPWHGSTREHELKGSLNHKGYRTVLIYRPDGTRLSRLVHQLVAEAFHGPRPDGAETRHLDGDKANNAASNLRYGTRSENQLDTVRHGTHRNASKTHCLRDHPFDETNTLISRGERRCRACQREYAAKHAAKHAA